MLLLVLQLGRRLAMFSPLFVPGQQQGYNAPAARIAVIVLYYYCNRTYWLLTLTTRDRLRDTVIVPGQE